MTATATATAAVMYSDSVPLNLPWKNKPTQPIPKKPIVIQDDNDSDSDSDVPLKYKPKPKQDDCNKCKNSNNPYHTCNEYCKTNVNPDIIRFKTKRCDCDARSDHDCWTVDQLKDFSTLFKISGRSNKNRDELCNMLNNHIK